MKGRYAISAAVAAKLYLLPTKDPIEILSRPIRFIFYFLAWGMIFHRESIPFTYGEQPYGWNGTCEDGIRQSPIHIKLDDTVLFEKAEPIVFINYDMVTLSVEIREHTIKFDPKLPVEGMMVGIAGGELRGFYELNHIHLHWGSSEHRLDNNSYVAEAHLVHFKSPHSNLTVDEVIDEPDGIAVLSVLFELGAPDKVLQHLTENLGRDINEAKLGSVKPTDFLPYSTDQFVRYRGSLTTPPCTEVVVWTVFPTPKTIAQYQIYWLKNKHLAGGEAEEINARAHQPINDRQITYMTVSYDYDNRIPEKSNAEWFRPKLWLTIGSILYILT